MTITNHAAVPDAPLIDRMWTYIPQLRAYLRQRFPNSEADDVVQDVLLRLTQCTPSQSIEFPMRYLFQVANTVVIDQRRRAMTRRAECHRELTDRDHPADELSPLRILLGREEFHMTHAALESLPPRTREIIIATRVECVSVKSVATRYGISLSAVEKHLTRGLRALSAALVSPGGHQVSHH